MPRKTRLDRVMRSAAALFAADGFAAASVSRLARLARVSKPGIYYHVRDKEELLFRICDDSMAGILAGAREAVGAADEPVARLRGVMRAHARFHWQHPNNLAILFGQMAYLSPERRRRIVVRERAYLDLVRGLIREGMRRRAFRRVDPSVAAFALFAMLNTLDAWYDPRGRLGPEALVRELERLYLDGLAAPGPARALARSDICAPRGRRDRRRCLR